METLVQDLQYALRTLGRARGFTAIAVLTLALGIGANSAIFSVVNGVLLRPLPYDQPEQLVRIYNENRELAVNSGAFSVPDFADLRGASTQIFSAVAGYFHAPAQTSITLRGEGRPERVPNAYVSADFFNVLGTAALRGRALSEEDNTPGKDRMVVLSHAAWQQRFGGAGNVLGKNLNLDGEPYTVVGVMPASFGYPRPEVEFWMPLSLLTEDAVGPLVRDNRWFDVIARTRPGVSVEAANAGTTQILARLERDHKDTNDAWGHARVRGLQEVLVGDVGPALMVLLGVVALVLLIACANLANLLLARSTTRVKEIAVRTALGASRGRIVRLVLTESVVLATAGGVLGLILSLWTVRVLLALGGDSIPRAESIRPDLTVVFFTLAISLVTGVVFGLVPALRSARGATASKLRDGGRGTTDGQERQRARGALVIIESALAVVLLVSAGLMIKSFYLLTKVDAGFESEGTVTMQIRIPESVNEVPGQDQAAMITAVGNYMQRVFREIEALPGVVSAASSKTMPLRGGAEPMTFSLPGAATDEKSMPHVGAYIVTPGFFETLGIPMLRGRDFKWDETTPTIVISRTLAQQLWPGQDAVGKELLAGGTPLEVVGVVGDVRNEGLAADKAAAVYISITSAPRSNQNLFIRTNGDPAALLPVLREAVWKVDPDQPIRNSATMREVKNATIARPQFFMTLIAVFGALALVLAAIGMYGVISYTMRQRTPEIGVRMALGATAGDVYQLVVGKAMQLALAGVAAGVIGALLLTRLMQTLLFGVAPTDPLSLAGAALALLLTAFLAAYLPARRAARISPSIAFRAE